MGVELPAIIALLDGIGMYGPWLVVVGLLLGIRTGELVLRREFLKFVDDAAKAATKAQDREAELIDEIQFWRTRHLQSLDMAQSAMGALTTRSHR